MPKTSQTIWIGIALLLALLTANSYVSYRALRRVALENSRVQHTQHLLFETERLKSLLVDAETGQRGYLYTRDPRYLDPYNKATREVDHQIEVVKALVAGRPAQLNRMARLEELAHLKLNELAETIRLDQQDKTTEAEAIVLSDVGQKTMEDIRGIIIEIEGDEAQEQTARVAHVARGNFAATLTFTVATAVACLALLIFGGMLLRETRKAEVAAAAVREQKEWLNTTLHSIGDAVIVTDASGIVVLLNDVAVSLTGYPGDEATGLPLRQVFPIFNEATHETAEDPVAKAIRLGTVVGLANHTVLRRRDGTEIAIDDSAAPIRNPRGELIGVVLVFRDVTSQRNLDVTLRNADKLATAARFAATLAHEINNPLEAVMNLLFLLNQESGLSAEGRHYLSLSQHELSRVAAVARQTLAFYKDTTSPEPVDIPVLLEQILALYGRRIENRGIRVVRDFDGAAACLAYPGELRQVFTNLIVNALDALPGNGFLTLRVKQEDAGNGRGLRVEVEDNGSGIEEKNLSKIFQPFFTTKKGVGTGLGLWSARSLVEKHQGQLLVESGDGTTRFTVLLPAANTAVRVQKAS